MIPPHIIDIPSGLQIPFSGEIFQGAGKALFRDKRRFPRASIPTLCGGCRKFEKLIL